MLEEHPLRGFSRQPSNASKGNIPSRAGLSGLIPDRPATLFPDSSRNATGRRECTSARTPMPSNPNLRRTPKPMPHSHQLPLSPSHISGNRSPTQAPPTDCQLSQSGGCAALSSDTPVPTPSGWIILRDIKPGHLVFDHTGKRCSVTAVCHRAEEPLYRVEFDDHSYLFAGARHPWVTLTYSMRCQIHKHRLQLQGWASRFIPFTTEDIQRHLLYEAGTCITAMHSVPLALPLQLPERPLEIDPYLLGLWLGDGNSKEAAITCHAMDEPHYRIRAAAAGERWRIRSSSKNVLTCALSKGPIPLFRTRLDALRLLGHKHVPQKYLRSAEPQRLALLQGLMDSDGTIDHRNGVAEYTSISERLARGVFELLLTLGQKATLTRVVDGAKLYGRIICDDWSVGFSPRVMVVSLPRKVETLAGYLEQRTAPALTRLDQRYIRAVEPHGVGPTTCIAVDSESGLLLAGQQMIPVSARRK